MTSIMVTAKYHDDLFYTNHFYAKVGGIGNKEINEMETEMTKLLNFQFRVTEQ